jgi:hypothetical protein
VLESDRNAKEFPEIEIAGILSLNFSGFFTGNQG